MGSVIPVSAIQAAYPSPKETGSKNFGDTVREWLSKGSEWVSQSLGAKLQRVVSFGKSVPLDPIRDAFEQNSLRRIRKHEKEKLIADLKALDPSSIPPTALVAFKEGNWSHEIFFHKDWPLFVLHFYIRGDLDAMEMSKLYLFEECRNLDRFQTHDLSNPDDFALFEKSIELFELGDRVAELKQLDPKDRQFFSFRFPLKNRISDPFNSARNENLNYFTVIDLYKNEFHIIVAPPELEYKINRIKNGENATQPDPVLGYDPSDRMEDPKKRVMCIPCRYVALPKHIHEDLETKLLGMYYHDMIHLVLDSSIHHKEIWSNLAKEFKTGKPGELLGDRNVVYMEKDLVGAVRGIFGLLDIFWLNIFNLSKDKKERLALLTHLFSKEAHLLKKHNLTFEDLERYCRDYGTSLEQSVFAEFKGQYRSRAASPAIGLI